MCSGVGAADGMGGCVADMLILCSGVGRVLYSTSLSGTLPESVGEMAGLSEL